MGPEEMDQKYLAKASRSGGAAPYGYKRTADGHYEPEPAEAPVRKLIYQLFLAHKRKLVVANKLNQMGYRTRSGAKFSDSSINRFLHDPIVTGHHKDNFLPSKGGNKYTVLKPESEWKFPPIQRLIEQDVWNEAQKLLIGQESTPAAKQPKAVFADYIYCACGGKMHRPFGRRSYSCAQCKLSIEAEIMAAIFQHQISSYSLDLKLIIEISEERKSEMNEFSKLETLRTEKKKLESEADKLYDLYINESISEKRFIKKNHPLEERINEIDFSLNTINASIQGNSELESFLSNQPLKAFGDAWAAIPDQSKRQLVELITQRIDVGTTNIKITLLYPPS